MKSRSFYSQIKKSEQMEGGTYFLKKRKVPVILTSAHGIEQVKRKGKIKRAEPFTRGITKYVSKKADCYCLIKNEDTGIDPNKINHDEFKKILADVIIQNHIKLLIDIHGAKRERDFNIEIGTADGITAKENTITKLVKS